MPTPVQFMKQYRNLKVRAAIEDPVAKVCRETTFTVALSRYFMMNWTAGSEQKKDYDDATKAKKNDAFFAANKERIRTAAMGKGSPRDYELALEWSLMQQKVNPVTQAALQTYCDAKFGIDCSGFATNYLIANGKKPDAIGTKQNTGAESYFSAGRAVNDPSAVRQGDLLVFMKENAVKTHPGHVAVVESYVPQSTTGGNMRVVEATGAAGANPKLLDSSYTVEKIIDKGNGAPAMILVVKRHGTSGWRVTVMRY